jgi:hypothetical protein
LDASYSGRAGYDPFTFASSSSRSYATSSTGSSQSAGITTFTTDNSSTYIFSSSGTFTAQQNFAGITTRDGTFGYSLPSTETYAFSQTFALLDETTLSATASATRTRTGSLSASYSGTGTAYLFGGPFSGQLFFHARENPPPLRRVAAASAVTQASVAASHYPAQSINTGNFLWIQNLYQRTSFSGTSESMTTDGTNFTFTYKTTTSFEYFKATQIESTALNGIAKASRKAIVSNVYLSHSGASQVHHSYSLSPADLTQIDSLFVSIASMVLHPRIFTSVLSGLTLAGESGSAQWIPVLSTWSLRLTTANTLSSGTLYGTIEFSGETSTTETSANAIVGNTTVMMGPLHPFTHQGLNVISVTLQENAASLASSINHPFYVMTGMLGTEWSETSFFYTGSSTQIISIGTATQNFVAASYPHSVLSAWKNRGGVSFSTQTTSEIVTVAGSDFTTDGVQFYSLGIPTVFKNSKWNEAGRNDQVSVSQ